MLSISGCDDGRRILGSRWIPAFAGMTSPTAGMTMSRSLLRRRLQLAFGPDHQQRASRIGPGRQLHRYIDRIVELDRRDVLLADDLVDRLTRARRYCIVVDEVRDTTVAARRGHVCARPAAGHVDARNAPENVGRVRRTDLLDLIEIHVAAHSHLAPTLESSAFKWIGLRLDVDAGQHRRVCTETHRELIGCERRYIERLFHG